MLRKDYKSPKFSVSNTRLDFLILNDSNVLANATFVVQPHSDWDGVLTLNVGESPKIKKIKINNECISLENIKKVKTSYGKDFVFENLTHLDNSEQSRRQNEESIIVSVTSELNPKANTSLSGLYLSDGILITQCESHGFREMFPSFDTPDILSKYKVRIHAPKADYPVILSNGNSINELDFPEIETVFPDKIPNNVTFSCITYEDPFAKPSYLFALVAGDLSFIKDTFKTMNGKNIDLLIYAKENIIEQCHFAMGALKRSMKHDEDLYGLEYDLDNYKVVGINDFNAGAMENKGLNIFNSAYILADSKYSTDHDFAMVDAVIAHEYFHNFTGNRVTLRDWFELTLKEGLTVFRDQEYSERSDSFCAARLEQISTIKNHQFKEDAGPNSHPIRPDEVLNMDNFYSSTVYDKGAEIIRMIANSVGMDNFHLAVKHYLDKYDGQAVTCDDFVDTIEKFTHSDFSQFKRWYSQNGTPKVDVKRIFDKEHGTVTLEIKQSYKEKGDDFKPFHIPFKMTLIDPKTGNQIPTGLKGDILDIKDEHTTVVFDCPTSDMPLISGLRDFSAPVVYTSDMTPFEIDKLMQLDDSNVSIVESFNDFKHREILNVINGHSSEFSIIIPSFINKKLEEMMLGDLDYTVVTNLLSIPTVSYLTTQVEKIDLETIYDSIDSLRVFIIDNCEKHIKMALEFLVSVKTDGKRLDDFYDFDYGVAKMRTIRYQLINLLSLKDSDLASSYLPEDIMGNNFSDKIYALHSCCNHIKNETLRNKMIDDIFNFSKENFNSLTSFISHVCSGNELFFDDIIRDYEKLIDFKNPNLVRSFLGGLASHRDFHNLNGKGYNYLKDKIIMLDKSNASLASILVTSLDYNKHKIERKTVLKECLLELQSKVKSSQVKEKLDKMLKS